MTYAKLNDQEQLQEAFRLMDIQYGDSIWDVGAHRGEFLQWLVSNVEASKILCFEPDVENFQYVSSTANAINQSMAFSIECFNVGIFYGMTESKVYGIGDGNNGGYMVELDPKYTQPINHRIHEYEGKTFQLVTLEDVLEYNNWAESPKLIKLDVEASEYNIIQHSQLLQQTPYILVEFHNFEDKPEEIVEFIKKHLPNHRIAYQNRQWLLTLNGY